MRDVSHRLERSRHVAPFGQQPAQDLLGVEVLVRKHELVRRSLQRVHANLRPPLFAQLFGQRPVLDLLLQQQETHGFIGGVRHHGLLPWDVQDDTAQCLHEKLTLGLYADRGRECLVSTPGYEEIRGWTRDAAAVVNLIDNARCSPLARAARGDGPSW